MLRPWLGNEPDGRARVQRSKIRDEFAKVIVVALLKLVLDYYLPTALIFGQRSTLNEPAACSRSTLTSVMLSAAFSTSTLS